MDSSLHPSSIKIARPLPEHVIRSSVCSSTLATMALPQTTPLNSVPTLDGFLVAHLNRVPVKVILPVARQDCGLALLIFFPWPPLPSLCGSFFFLDSSLASEGFVDLGGGVH